LLVAGKAKVVELLLLQLLLHIIQLLPQLLVLTIRLAVEDVIVSCYLPSNGTMAVGSNGSEKPASISEEAVKVLDSEIGVLRELCSDGRVAVRKLAEELDVFLSNGCKMANEECSLWERDYILWTTRD
jgi:hypothetical protein